MTILEILHKLTYIFTAKKQQRKIFIELEEEREGGQ